MRDDILVVEISGKRAGDKSARPTEKFDIQYPHLIISNNSEGYISDWEIVNVPDDYKDWYVENMKCSENAWYAPMNRSYAIKYAKEHGYKYLVQLDDNIVTLAIGYKAKQGGIVKCYQVSSRDLINDFIDTMATVLDYSDAAQVGLRLNGTMPDSHLLAERRTMTTISINSDCIKMRGHAGYAPSGQDIVCAGLTALVQTLIRSIESLTSDKINYCISSARVDIDLRNLSERSRLLVDSFFIGICEIAGEFPNNVRII